MINKVETSGQEVVSAAAGQPGDDETATGTRRWRVRQQGSRTMAGEGLAEDGARRHDWHARGSTEREL